jgi:hypothetical protein
MYRKISHITIFIMLLSATTGMAVSKHFCNGLLISFSIYMEADSCCDKDCCQDQSEFVQLDEEFQLTESSEVPAITELGLLFAGPEHFNFSFRNEYLQVQKPENEPPPPGTNTLLSLRQTYLL